MAERSEVRTVYKGRHLSMVERNRWEFATRNTKKPAVGIVAITGEGKVVVVEQFRPAVGQTVVELPAGLAGDLAGSEDEALLEAAKRELLEETGYTATDWKELSDGFSSPGLTDESIVLFLARGLKKAGPGGGDDSEDIVIHEVGFNAVAGWVTAKGCSIDLKLMAGLYLAQQELAALDRK